MMYDRMKAAIAKELATMPATTTTLKQTRTCGWTFKPFNLPSGGRMGFFHVREGRAFKSDEYRAVLLDSDDMAQVWEVSKEQPDGTFGEAYTVVLPAPGAGGDCTCTCPGHTYRRTSKPCRHVGALRTLLGRLLG